MRSSARGRQPGQRALVARRIGAADLQDEVIDPPQVTPTEASSFDSEMGRIGSEVLFGWMSPEQAAQAVLDLLESFGE